MKTIPWPLLVCWWATLVLALVSGAWASSSPAKPNVVIILADDLGYSDLGCYGGEMATPHLDSLAGRGLRFTQFYNTARCWSSRASLLSGYYAQQVHRDQLPGEAPGKSRGRQSWARLLPDFLKPAGYRRYHSGKWHVDGKVLDGGFDKSLNIDKQINHFSGAGILLDDQPAPRNAPDYHATSAIAEHAIACLKDHAAHHAGRPFFSYIAFTAPHFPLQARSADIAKYSFRYNEGWEAMRATRYRRQGEFGFLPTGLSALEIGIGPPYDFPEAIKQLGPGEINRPLPWADLTEEQRKFQATKMAIHAAMVDQMDQEVGRFLGQLKSMGAMDNTLILFASDNGASAEIMVRDSGHAPTAPPGSAATYLCLGPGFSSACNTPFRRHKVWVHEGGISTPLIVHWPKGIGARGELRHSPGHLIDIVPTVLEATGIEKPAMWMGRAIPEAPGLSLVPLFAKDHAQPPRRLWWLHEGNRAIRVGDWKLVAAKGEPWELYDLKSDRAEQNNLADQLPGKAAELEKAWEEEARRIAGLAHQPEAPGAPDPAAGK